MREIKFRAWHKHNSRMMFRGVFDRNWYTESRLGKCIDGIHPSDSHNVELMQYTGLKDTNGVEIYEGDIVKGWIHNPDEMHVVEFFSDKYHCGFMARSVGKHGKIHVWYENLEIIGNIYENPELLEGK